MSNSEFFKQAFYYFVRLPLFSIRLHRSEASTLEDIAKICPRSPKTASYYEAIVNACNTYPFLKGQSPERLSALYNLISAVRESDVFIYPFLSRKNIASLNIFHNLETLAETYKTGPVLILYSHTGSYYQVIAATGILGYKIYPVAYNIDASVLERPLRWLLSLNMKLSERHFSGGYYLYTGTPVFLQSLKRILSNSERAVIYAAIDLPQFFITEKRLKVNFLDRETAFPYKFIEFFSKSRLPILTAFPSVEAVGDRIKRIVTFEKVPDALSAPEVLQFYAHKLDEFIRKKPEQLLTLISLGGFFV